MNIQLFGFINSNSNLGQENIGISRISAFLSQNNIDNQNIIIVRTY